MKARLTILAFAVLGCLIALGIQLPIMDYLSDGGLTHWQSLGSPPDRIDKLVGFSWGSSDVGIFVETVSGDFYRWLPSSQQEWEEIEPFQGTWTEHLVCEPLPPRAPLPPGSVVSCAESRTYEWLLVRDRFVLLADGTVWKWHQQVSVLNSLYILGGGCVGGGLLGILTAWLSMRKPLRPSVRASDSH